jgi:hypothetical protein
MQQYGENIDERSGRISMDMGRPFENTKTGGKAEPKKGSEKEGKKKRTKDRGKIDKPPERNTRTTPLQTVLLDK